MKKSTKVVIIVGIVLAILPLVFFSGPGLKKWEDSLWAKENEPDTPKNLWTLIRIYDSTGRIDTALPIIKKWVTRYGGDDYEPDDRYFPWDKPEYTEDNPRPPTWNKEPHPLTPNVLLLIAEHMEKSRDYVKSRHFFKLLQRRFPNADSEVVRRVQQAMTRDQSGNRSF